jgi:hypothetical protein
MTERMAIACIECSASSMFRWKPLRNDDSILQDVINVAVPENKLGLETIPVED